MKIYTWTKLEKGAAFTFYGNIHKRLKQLDVVEVWNERERDGLGDEIVYATALVTITPKRNDGLYLGVIQ